MERSQRLQSIGAALIILFTTLPVYGEDVDEFFQLRPLPARLIPQYVPCVYMNTQFACFNKDQTTELFLFELRAKYWHEQWREHFTLLSKKDEQLAILQEQIKKYQLIERESQLYIQELNRRIVQEISAKNKCYTKVENRPKWPLWVGGIVATLGAGAFLGGLFY